MLGETIQVKIREIIAVGCFIASLVFAAGTYKSKFEESQSRITNLTQTMEKLSVNVETLNRTMVKLETRLDYVEKSK